MNQINFGKTNTGDDIMKKLMRIIDRGGELLFQVLLLPFFLPSCIRLTPQQVWIRLVLVIPNGIVWFSIYLYLVHLVLIGLGFSDEDVRLLAPLSADPHAHFGTTFFSLFFPIMLYYLYLSYTNQWDKSVVQGHFAEHIPSKQEQKKEREAKRLSLENRKQFYRFFWKRLPWTGSVFILLFVGANLGADSATPWSEILILSLTCAILLAGLFAFLSVERLGKKK